MEKYILSQKKKKKSWHPGESVKQSTRFNLRWSSTVLSCKLMLLSSLSFISILLFCVPVCFYLALTNIRINVIIH